MLTATDEVYCILSAALDRLYECSGSSDLIARDNARTAIIDLWSLQEDLEKNERRLRAED